MEKILIIDSGFATTGGSRIDKFVKYLPNFGYEPIVITTRKLCLRQIVRENRIDRYNSMLCIIPARQWIAFGTLQRMVQRITGYDLHARLLFPDRWILWRRFALRAARRVIEKENLNLIFSTSPPMSNHAIAMQLKREYPGLRWVADFRDPWYDDLRIGPAAFHPLQRGRAGQLLADILNNADALVTINRQCLKKLNAILPLNRFEWLTAKTTFIMNGYDPEDFGRSVPARRPDGTMVVSYFGNLDKHSSCVEEFLAGFAVASAANPELRLHIFHTADSNLSATLALYGITDRVIVDKPRSHRAALERLACVADLLLVMRTPEYSFAVSQKLFSYWTLGRPILAVCEPTSEVARLVKETCTGKVVPIDPQSIADALMESVALWRKGELEVVPDKEVVRQYERRALTGKLASVYDALLGTQGTA